MNVEKMKYRKVSELHPLPENPRKINRADLDRLVNSLRINGFWEHQPMAVEEQGGKLIVLSGNQRLKACKRLKMEEVPTVLYSDLTDDERTDIILRSNINNGDWDFGILTIEPAFQDVDFDFVGITIPDVEKEGRKRTARQAVQQTTHGDERESDVEDEEENGREAFYRSMFKDVLYESDNAFDIPNLLLEMQAGKVELPLSPWGANSRLRKDVATYHFYVDDYRFEALFKDPIKLLTSGCRAVVEPNCSCHDQTPHCMGNPAYIQETVAFTLFPGVRHKSLCRP